MNIRIVVIIILRVIALFWGIVAILGFFALFGLAQVIPVLDVLGGGISAIMALVFGLFLFSICYAAAEILNWMSGVDKTLKELKNPKN